MQCLNAGLAQAGKENRVPVTRDNGKKRCLNASTTATVAAAAVTIPGQCGLLSLPAEIRRIIFGYLANKPVVDYATLSRRENILDIQPALRLLLKKFGMTVRVRGLRYPVYIHRPVDVSLLLVCRQFYHDAVAVLFREQEIHVEVGDGKALTRFSHNVMPRLPPTLRKGIGRLHLHVYFANRSRSRKPMAMHIKQSVRAAIQGINQLASDLPQTPLPSLKISWFETQPRFLWEDRKRVFSTLKKLRPRQIEVGALEAIWLDKPRHCADSDPRKREEASPFDVDYLQTLVIKRYLPVVAPEQKYARELAAKQDDRVKEEL